MTATMRTEKGKHPMTIGLISLKEAAKLVGYSADPDQTYANGAAVLRQAIGRGDLSGVRIGRDWFVSPDNAKRYAEEHPPRYARRRPADESSDAPADEATDEPA